MRSTRTEAPDTRDAAAERALTPKAQATRSAIIDAALGLFIANGYDETTMRAVAAEAGVSLGNAYYYFRSKEELIQGFYERVAREHAPSAAVVFSRETSLEARLGGYLSTWLDTTRPYRSFAAAFFRNAADPASPLSPFSPASAPTRDMAIALLAEAVDGSDTRPPKALRAELPELLWLYSMGIVLFWVHDQSDDSARTRALAARTVPMVVRAISLAKLPIVRGMVEDVVALVGELRSL